MEKVLYAFVLQKNYPCDIGDCHQIYCLWDVMPSTVGEYELFNGNKKGDFGDK